MAEAMGLHDAAAALHRGTMPDPADADPGVLTIGPFSFEPATGRGWSPCGQGAFPPDQAAILLCLLQHVDEPIPAATLARVLRPHHVPAEKPEKQLRRSVQAVAACLSQMAWQRVTVRGRPDKGDGIVTLKELRRVAAGSW